MSLFAANERNRTLACSVNFDRQDLLSGRELCQDRVPFFHQLGPRRFVKTVRLQHVYVSCIQLSLTNNNPSVFGLL